MYLRVNSFLLRRLVNTFSLLQSSATHRFKYMKILTIIQYYLPTYSLIFSRDSPVQLILLTSCTHFLYVFDTFNFELTQNNRTI